METGDRLFRVENNSNKGRVLVATRNLAPLDIILNERPAVVAPNHHQSEHLCLGCLKELDSERLCPTCHYPVCDQNCTSSSVHMLECDLLSRLEVMEDEDINYQIIAVIRLLLVHDQNKTVWSDIDQLMDHVEERRNNEEEWDMFQTRTVRVVKLVRPDVEERLLDKLIGIIYTNSVSFDFRRKEGSCGRALYPVLSLLSHSCVSNAKYTVNPDGFSVVLRAKKPIVEGEEITISYMPPIHGEPKRKQHILDEWYFSCQCPRCSDVTEFGTFVSALKCDHCREGLILPQTSKEGSLWVCRFCSNPYEPAMIEFAVAKIENELHYILNTSYTVKELESFMKKNLKNLHKNHYLNLIAQRNIIQLYSKEKTVTRISAAKTIKFCKSFKSTMSVLDPGLSEWLGFVLRNLNKAQLQILNINLKEKKVNNKSFAEESEAIWRSMREVDQCDILCTPVKHVSN